MPKRLATTYDTRAGVEPAKELDGIPAGAD